MKNLLQGHAKFYLQRDSEMTIQELSDKIIKSAESIDGFYEVELSILIRTEGGQRSSFVRLHSDLQKPDFNSEEVKQNNWF
jgi:hypothetical protein